MNQNVRIADHMSIDEVKLKLQYARGFLQVQKWLIIYNALADPRPISEIAIHLSASESLVYRTIQEYNERGPKVIEEGKRPLYVARAA